MPAPAHIAQDPDSEGLTKVTSKSRKHGFYSHFPKDRNCEVCLRTKMTRAPCRRRTGEAAPRAEKFGDLITADQKVSVKKVNRGTNIDVPWWYKTWQISGYNPTRAEQKLLRRPRRAGNGQFLFWPISLLANVVRWGVVEWCVGGGWVVGECGGWWVVGAWVGAWVVEVGGCPGPHSARPPRAAEVSLDSLRTPTVHV